MILNKRKNNIKTSILLVLLMSSFNLFGQTTYWGSGSRDWYPSGVDGVRAYLRSSTVTTNPESSWPFANTGTHYVYAKEGETIALASSVQATNINTLANIELYNPLGDKINIETHTGTGNTPGTRYGHISNRAAEIAGPQLKGATGDQGNRYRPIFYTVPIGGEGIYRVEFKSTYGQNGGNINYTVAANGNWTQGTNHAGIMAWDVSVINTTNTGFMSGRVYANVLNLSNGYTTPQNNHFYGLVYVLTKDGYTYRVDNNGNNGMFFTFFVNNNGFINENGLPRYTSLPTSTTSYLNGKVHNPNFQDGNGQITHKMFYSLPGKDLPETTSISYSSQPNTTTWLNGEVVEPNVTNVKLIGSEGIEGQVSNKGGYINFEADAQGHYTIEIESDVIPAEFVKRTLIGSSISGLNEIYWDGKAGDGTTLPAGNNLAKITVQLQGAEVHFPFIDMEYNTKGIIIELLDHEKLALATPVIESKSDIVYWNDGGNSNDPFYIPNGTSGNNSPFGRYSSPRNNSHLNGSTGISSNTNGHIWGQGASGTSGQFGDNRSIDTWTFIKGQKAEINTTVRTKVADLQVTELSADNTSEVIVNEIVTYTIKLKNGGPSDVENAPFHFVVPDGFIPAEGGFFTFSGAECGTEAVELAFDATTHTFKSELNLPNGCEVTYTIKVKVTGEATPGEGTLSAGIMRPYDVYDPDGTNTSDPENPLGDLEGAYDLDEFFYPPFDPFFEVEHNGQSGSNNVKEIQISIADCEEKVLFYEDFGISDLNNGNMGRSESAFMPANSFEFGNSYLQLPTPGGNPWDDNPIRNAARINDGFYAVVAPEFIKDGWFPDDGWDSWWPPAQNNGYQIVSDHTGNSNTATHKGAVMAINAGEVLAPFYENSVTVEPATLYKASFWFYLLPGEDPTKIALDIFDSETNQLLGTVETALMGGDVDPSYIGKWTEHTLYFLTGACSVNDVKFSLRNGYEGTQGNDYFIDDIKLVKWGCEIDEDFYVEIECPKPIATPDINQTPEGKPVNGNVLTNDSGEDITVTEITVIDEDGNSKTVTVPTTGTVTEDVYTLDENGDPVKTGTITIGSNGKYIFTPEPGYIGNVPVEYTITDTNGNTDTTTLTIEVIPTINPSQNSTPIAQDDAYTTVAGKPITSNILSNDSDVDGNTLTVTGATQGGTPIVIGTPTQVSGVDSEGNPVANAGTVTINTDGTITFTPAEGFVGEMNPINYTISDGNGGTDEANIYLNVLPDTGKNTTFANDDANTGKKGETLTGNVLGNDNDPEGNTQILTSVTIDGTDYPIGPDTEIVIPGKGTLTMNPDGSYTFVPEDDFVGTVVVEQTVCDDATPEAACDQATLYLTNVDSSVCFKPGNFISGSGLPTNVGITSLRLSNTDGWPQVREGAWIALESKTKGFVPNRLTTPQITAIPVANLVKGMMVYNITEDCLQINVDGTATGWKCFNVQTCD